ncbi:M1 family metallopeptidase [Desertivirga arenae]|uniref:M1 family metallopeptidase n=1 Tax=Desertivirga arenae TaxID=2810309 RepID=UPI001A966AC9|nr:M1 family aminopeptidase [Pedobacter sp. SYSU D00823]
MAQQKSVVVEPGVSIQLAKYRKSVIDQIHYNIILDIPGRKTDEIKGTVDVSFYLQSTEQDLQLDFKQDASHIKDVRIDEKPVLYKLEREHLIILSASLRKGVNRVKINFIAGNEALNRNEEYIYALFVPDRARLTFPCFDQPDLKAIFTLTLRVPKEWTAISVAREKNVLDHPTRREYQFSASEKLPTYLFSFTTGKFSTVEKQVSGFRAKLLYRETDTAKIKFSTDSIFKAHQDAIAFLENWTGIPFPFQKVGFAAIPDFQFGGMEHPGAVQYKASSLFLDESATKDQHINRANLISHETAHMWFGDLVTMEWFNDVWMKEVFANFMADKIAGKIMGSEAFDLKFLQDHYPAAYSVDRTQGANPIRQQLDNLQEAGSMYGNIIYHKAPIMMRQLESLMGEDQFRQGIQEYLKKYAYNNATWPDLISILSKYSNFNLYEWNKVWVNLPGRPVFDYVIKYEGNRIKNFTLLQKPESGVKRCWPQVFQLIMAYPSGNKIISVNIKDAEADIPEAIGLPKPEYIIFNSDGTGYGLFPNDRDLDSLLFSLKNPLHRAVAYIAAYENMLAGRYYKPAELLQLLKIGITRENDEMNLRLLCGYISSIYWNLTSAADRPAVSAILEKKLWEAIPRRSEANHKKVIFQTYQSVYMSSAAKSRMLNIWQKQEAPEGLKLSEDDYTSIAFSIALKSDTLTPVLQDQRDRISNNDRKERIDFLIPALSADPKVRDAFFNSLKKPENRQKEAWVTTALTYLNHPLRQNSAIKYLGESLNMLDEIQRTGDIFFPQSWLNSIWNTYQSSEAAQVAKEFLRTHPNYNPRLRDKILQAADNVFRAEKLLKE